MSAHDPPEHVEPEYRELWRRAAAILDKHASIRRAEPRESPLTAAEVEGKGRIPEKTEPAHVELVGPHKTTGPEAADLAEPA